MRNENGIIRLTAFILIGLILIGIAIIIINLPGYMASNQEIVQENDVKNENVQNEVKNEVNNKINNEITEPESDSDFELVVNTNTVNNEVVLVTNDQIADRENEENQRENTETVDIFVNSRVVFNGIASLSGFIIDENGNIINISFNPDEFNIPLDIYNFKTDVKFRVNYDINDTSKVYSCIVIDAKTGDTIEDLSLDNLNRLYNIEYGKEIINLDWKEKFKLSELKENEVYKCTADTEYSQYPILVNDTNRDCIIFEKSFFDNNYNKKLDLINEIPLYENSSDSPTFSDIQPNDDYTFMYRFADETDVFNMIDESDIVNLAPYNIGETINYSFEEYLYNNSENDIVLKVQRSSYSDPEDAVLYTIPAGQIFEFSWMIDLITVEDIIQH